MKNEIKDKEVFVKMCSEIDFSYEFYFPAIEHKKECNEITSYENYPILVEKIENLVKLLNNNPELINLDIETELWYMC